MNKKIAQINDKIAHWIATHTKTVLTLSLLVFIVSVFLSTRISLNPNVRDMIPDNDPQIEAYDKIIANYVTTEVITLSVTGNDKKQMVEALEYMASKIKADSIASNHISSFNYRPEKGFFSKYGLMFVPPEKISGITDNPSLLEGLMVVNSKTDSLLSGDKEVSSDSIPSMINSYANIGVEKVNHLFKEITDYISEGDYKKSDSVAYQIINSSIWDGLYITSPDEKVIVASIVPNFSSLEYSKTKTLISRLYEFSDECESKYPEVDVGVAGNIAMNYDRTTAMARDMSWPSGIALILITILFYFSLRNFRAALLAIITLFFGIAMSYGIISFYPGEINSASSMVIVLLIGLGIDFGIHIITHYNQYLRETGDKELSLKTTLNESGTGIVIGAITTAVAFFILTFSDSRGLSDLGFIAGVGILSCMFSMIVVLPALLFAFGGKHGSQDNSVSSKYYAKLDKFISARAIMILVIAVLSAGYMGYLGSQNYREISRLQMEDPEGQSVLAMENLLKSFNRSSDALLLTVPSTDEARSTKEELLKNPLISKVETISDLIKSEKEQNERLVEIKSLREKLQISSDASEKDVIIALYTKEVKRLTEEDLDDARLKARKQDLDKLKADKGTDKISSPELLLNLYLSQLKTMQGNFRELIDLAQEEAPQLSQKLSPLVGTTKDSTSALNDLIKSLNSPEKAQALYSLDISMRKYMLEQVKVMAQLDRPMTIDDLPNSIASKYLSKDKNENLIRIFPKNDIWQTDVLEELEKSIVPQYPSVVGAALIFKRFNENVFDEAIKMSLYALLAVVLILFFNLRSIKATIMIVLPLVIGVVWMFGLMELFELRYSFTSMISFPMVLGIGIDTGIHLYHGYIHTGSVGRMLQVTGKAVLLSSFTSMIGFGAIGFAASTGGVRNFGQTLFWGVGACLIAAIFVFSALLYVMQRKEQSRKSA